MTADTLEAEDEMTVRRFMSIEDMIIFHNPHLEYLINLTLPVRPATEAEAAAYTARKDAPEWQEIYCPAEPRIILPPSAPELTTLLSVVRDPEPEGNPAIGGLADDLAQHDATAALARWAPKADTGSLSVVRDEPEVHHENTVVLQAVPDGDTHE